MPVIVHVTMPCHCSHYNVLITMIVKFTTWRHRTRFYRSRKKLSAAKVYLDLTQAKFKLLTSSQEKVRGSTVVDFVFADVNCALCALMTNGILSSLLL